MSQSSLSAAIVAVIVFAALVAFDVDAMRRELSELKSKASSRAP